MSLFNTSNEFNSEYFWDLLKEIFKWSLVIEFIVNFYTFNLIIEIFLLPTILILALTQTLTESDKKYIQINKFLRNLLAIISLLFIAVAIYQTFKNYKCLFQIQNLFSFLLPPILTVLLIPFLYFLAVYLSYDSLFAQINYLSKDLNKNKLLKRAIVLKSKLNLNRLKRISSGLNYFELDKSNDIKIYLKKLLK